MKTLKERETEYLKEIHKIREEMDNLNNGFAKNLQAEELDGFPLLYPNKTGLPYYVFIDNGECYQEFHHPLCLYVYNQPGDIVPDGKITPVIISDNPQVVGDELYKGNEEVFEFIKNNLNNLLLLADMKIDIGNFYDDFLSSKQRYAMVDEMSVLNPEVTGLPVKVYVDDTGSYKRSGHNQSYRFKYQQDKDIANPYLWMPILIPSLKIEKSKGIPPRKVKASVEKMVLEWGKKNLDLLIKLGKQEIDGITFEENMVRYDTVDVILDSRINPDIFKMNIDSTNLE